MTAASPALRGSPGPSSASGAAGRIRCWNCGAEQPVAPLCSSCETVLPLPPDTDHYVVFGMHRHLAVDADDLARRYYELSRRLHPDRHGAGPAQAREASLHNQAALTRAYRTLRDPLARARYWLELHGVALGDDNRVPPELASLVFEVQEKLEELRATEAAKREDHDGEVRAELERLRAQADRLEAETAALFAESDGGDAATVLPRLKALLSRRSYLATLVRDVEAALG